MTREFTNGHPQRLPACNFLLQYYFYNIFLQKSCRFSLETLAKFEAAKTGSCVGFLRLTAVWSQSSYHEFSPSQCTFAMCIFEWRESPSNILTNQSQFAISKSRQSTLSNACVAKCWGSSYSLHQLNSVKKQESSCVRAYLSSVKHVSSRMF